MWGLERLTLAGYSWGGLLALLYAIELPDRVGRLALVSPAPAWREARLEFERRFAERNLAPELQQQRAELRESGLREQDPADYAQTALRALGGRLLLRSRREPTTSPHSG